MSELILIALIAVSPVVKVKSWTGNTAGVGSGTLVHVNDDGVGIVLTAYHVIDPPGRLEVTYSNGSTQPASYLGRDEGGLDLAAIAVQSPPTVRVESKFSGRVRDASVWGYGGSAGLKGFRGLYQDTTNNGSDRFRIKIRHGDSGGGIFDPEGNFCGVVWGCRHASPYPGTYGYTGKPVKRFLDRFR